MDINTHFRLLVNIWFQFYFTVLSDYFSPFPHGTSSLSVSTMYLALPVSSGGFLPAIRVWKYSGIITKEVYTFRIRDYHPLWCWFPTAFSIYTLCNSSRNKTTLLPYNPAFRRIRFGLFPFRSPLLRESYDIHHIFFFSSRY
jgi:hypothetical protein